MCAYVNVGRVLKLNVNKLHRCESVEAQWRSRQFSRGQPRL